MKMLIDLTGRGHIRLTGDDRARLLHAMTTNHVQQMKPGEWIYAFFLTAQGRIIADANIICREEDFIVDTEPETRRLVYQHIDRYIIADDVTIEDLSDETAVLSLEGESDIAVSAPAWKVSGISATGLPAVRIFAPIDRKAALIEQIGPAPASEAEWNRVRIENAHPRYGVDFCEHQIPQETQLLHALHFSKGCYLGQEIVERVRSRGHVNRKLVQLFVESEMPPARESKLFSAEGKEVGEISSAAYSPNLGKVVAMGLVRAEAISAKLPLRVGEAAVTISERDPH